MFKNTIKIIVCVLVFIFLFGCSPDIITPEDKVVLTVEEQELLKYQAETLGKILIEYGFGWKGLSGSEFTLTDATISSTMKVMFDRYDAKLPYTNLTEYPYNGSTGTLRCPITTMQLAVSQIYGIDNWNYDPYNYIQEDISSYLLPVDVDCPKYYSTEFVSSESDLKQGVISATFKVTACGMLAEDHVFIGTFKIHFSIESNDTSKFLRYKALEKL